MTKTLNKSLVELKQFDSLNKDLDAWERRVSQWAAPGSFDALYKQLTESLVPWMQDDSLLKTITNPKLTRVERSIAVHLMFRIVSCVDQTIKSAKSATDIDEQIRVANVVKLLEPYHAMMEGCVNAIPAEQFNSWIHQIDDEPDKSKRPQMLSSIASAFERCKKAPTAAQLLPSGTCNVASCCVGSGADFARQFAEDKVTLEDLFSLMHQNILKSITVLNQEGGIRPKELPTQLKPITELLSRFSVDFGFTRLDEGTTWKVKSDLTSVDVSDYPYINLDFNLPLANHSATIEVQFNTLTKSSKVTLNLFTQYSYRFEPLLPYAFVWSWKDKVSLAENPTNRNGQLTVQWKFEGDQTKEQIENFEHLLTTLIWGPIISDSLRFKYTDDDIQKLFKQETTWYQNLKLISKSLNPRKYNPCSLVGISGLLFREASRAPTSYTQDLVNLVRQVPELADYPGENSTVVESNFNLFQDALKEHPEHLWQLTFNTGPKSEFITKLLDANIPCDLVCPSGDSPLRWALQSNLDYQLILRILERSPNQAQEGRLILDLIHSGKYPGLIPTLEAKGAKLTPELLAADKDPLPLLARLQPYLERERDKFNAIYPLMLGRSITSSYELKQNQLDWIHYLIDKGQVDLSTRNEKGHLKYITLAADYTTWAEQKSTQSSWSDKSSKASWLKLLEMLLQKSDIAPNEKVAIPKWRKRDEIPETMDLLKRHGITVIDPEK